MSSSVVVSISLSIDNFDDRSTDLFVLFFLKDIFQWYIRIDFITVY